MSLNTTTASEKSSCAKLTHRERVVNFLSLYPEFESERSLHQYYLSFDDQAYLANFWSDILKNYQQSVVKSFTINKAQIMKDFTIHGREPVALPEIIELQKHLVPKQEIMNGQYYGIKNEEEQNNQSYFSYFGTKIYENTIGYYFGSSEQKSEETNEEYVNVDLLERIASSVQRWAEENSSRTSIMEANQLRKQIRRALQSNEYIDVDDNIELILRHLKCTGRMATGVINVSQGTDLKIVKLAAVGAEFQTSEIATEEKAPFQLQEVVKQIDQDIAARQQRVREMNQQCIQLGKQKQSQAALAILAQRKNLEKYISGQQSRKYHLEEVLMGIESGQQNQMMLESLKVAREAGKAVADAQTSGTGASGLETFEDLMNDIREQQQQQSSIDHLFVDASNVEDDGELLKELEALEEPIPEQISSKADPEEDDLIKRLKELEIPNQPINPQKVENKKEAVIL